MEGTKGNLKKKDENIKIKDSRENKGDIDRIRSKYSYYKKKKKLLKILTKKKVGLIKNG